MNLTEQQINQLKTVRERLACELSLYEFLKYSWSSIEGTIPFIPNWHLSAIAEHLEACLNREIRNLLINIPPRMGKTNLISVALPAYAWIKAPEEKFMYASYANSLALEHSLKCRRLIESPWYQKHWGNNYNLRADQNAKSYFENNYGGYRISTSVGASSTGKGASILVTDDPNNARDFDSDIKRESINKWWDQVWSTRLNNPKKDVKIVVQQRIHEADVSGHIIENDKDELWVKLILPMEFENARRTKTVVLPSSTPDIWNDPRQKEGALLAPERFGVKEVLKLRAELGSYGYAGQCQQRPSPATGGILKKAWFKIYQEKSLPVFSLVLQSWDTAFSDSAAAAYSACTTWGLFEKNGVNNILLLSCWRGQVGYPELRERAKRLFLNFNDTGDIPKQTRGLSINKCIIEKKATGDPLIRDLKDAGIKPIAYTPKGDKMARVQIVSPYIEAGIVHLLNRPENLLFLEEAAKFPNASSRDYVDTLSQVLGFLRDNNMLTIPKDPPPEVTVSNTQVPYFKSPD